MPNKVWMDWVRGSHASTFGGNNLACAAGFAVLEVMSEDGFGDRVIERGRYLLDGLEKLLLLHEDCIPFRSRWRREQDVPLHRRLLYLA